MQSLHKNYHPNLSLTTIFLARRNDQQHSSLLSFGQNQASARRATSAQQPIRYECCFGFSVLYYQLMRSSVCLSLLVSLPQHESDKQKCIPYLFCFFTSRAFKHPTTYIFVPKV